MSQATTETDEFTLVSTGTIDTVDDFKNLVAIIQSDPRYNLPQAYGLAAVRRDKASGKVLDVRFPTVNLQENPGAHAVLWSLLDDVELVSPCSSVAETLEQALDYFTPYLLDGNDHANITAVRLLMELFENQDAWDDEDAPIELVLKLVESPDLTKAPASAEEVWLRLHLLSHRKVAPNHTADFLQGAFGLLTNVAWTNYGPFLPEWLNRLRFTLDDLDVYGIDKFPKMLNYVTPPEGETSRGEVAGVRIADASRVRLGAHLAPGTTVMHEGFVNFNAGTLGVSMVEGRISAGVEVGDGTDVGGGASMMGTLSGGGSVVISVGERTLLGANSGLGIPLGDDCIVEAGLYLTAGTKVTITEELKKLFPDIDGNIVSARDLAGISGVVFRRNSVYGNVEMVPNTKGTPALNSALHNN